MKWNIVLGTAISALFVLIIFYQVDFEQLLAALRAVHVLPAAVAAVLIVCTHLVRAWRWQYFLEPIKRVRTTSLFSAVSIGFMANMLLPAHAGEVVRAYLVGHKERVGTMASLATIVVERVADFTALLVIMVVTLASIQMPPEMASVARHLKLGGYLAAGLGVLLVGGLWLLGVRTPQTVARLRRWLAFLPEAWLARLLEALRAFALGLQSLRRGAHVAPVMALSFVLWGIVALCNWLVLFAFDLQLPFYAAFFILILQSAGVVVPSAPGFIGTYHAAVMLALAVFGVSRELALSVALVMHATFFFPFILVGLVCLWGESLSWHDLQSVRARPLAPAGTANDVDPDSELP